MSEWIEHDGRGPPDPKRLVQCDIKFRDGTVFEEENSDDWWPEWRWASRAPSPSDIVAYRLTSDAPEAR